MTEKDLKELKREELLELFIEQSRRIEVLEAELSEMKAELDSMNTRINNLSSTEEAPHAPVYIIEDGQMITEESEIKKSSTQKVVIEVLDPGIEETETVQQTAKGIDPQQREENIKEWIQAHQVPEKYQSDERSTDTPIHKSFNEDVNNNEIIDIESTDDEIEMEEIIYEHDDGVVRPIIPTNEAVTIKVRQTPIRQLKPNHIKQPTVAGGLRKPKPVKPMLSKHVKDAVK